MKLSQSQRLLFLLDCSLSIANYTRTATSIEKKKGLTVNRGGGGWKTLLCWRIAGTRGGAGEPGRWRGVQRRTGTRDAAASSGQTSGRWGREVAAGRARGEGRALGDHRTGRPYAPPTVWTARVAAGRARGAGTGESSCGSGRRTLGARGAVGAAGETRRYWSGFGSAGDLCGQRRGERSAASGAGDSALLPEKFPARCRRRGRRRAAYAGADAAEEFGG